MKPLMPMHKCAHHLAACGRLLYAYIYNESVARNHKSIYHFGAHQIFGAMLNERS